MYLGRPTGAAMPLMWAHAEYIKLLRSTLDGEVLVRIPQVAERYVGDRRRCRQIEVWKFNRQVRRVRHGHTLRIILGAPFEPRWTLDEWNNIHQTPSQPTALDLAWVDIPIPAGQKAPARFTIFWPNADRWEGRDFLVSVVP